MDRYYKSPLMTTEKLKDLQMEVGKGLYPSLGEDEVTNPHVSDWGEPTETNIPRTVAQADEWIKEAEAELKQLYIARATMLEDSEVRLNCLAKTEVFLKSLTGAERRVVQEVVETLLGDKF